MKERFRIQIASGEAKGRFVGAHLDSGSPSNLQFPSDSPINVAGSDYGLHRQEKAATEFFEGSAKQIQVELQILGYESRLVQVK